jgi:hypothetical protein
MRDPMLPTYLEWAVFLAVAIFGSLALVISEIRSEAKKDKIRQQQMLNHYFRNANVVDLQGWTKSSKRRMGGGPR